MLHKAAVLRGYDSPYHNGRDVLDINPSTDILIFFLLYVLNASFEHKRRPPDRDKLI